MLRRRCDSRRRPDRTGGTLALSSCCLRAGRSGCLARAARRDRPHPDGGRCARAQSFRRSARIHRSAGLCGGRGPLQGRGSRRHRCRARSRGKSRRRELSGHLERASATPHAHRGACAGCPAAACQPAGQRAGSRPRRQGRSRGGIVCCHGAGVGHIRDRFRGARLHRAGSGLRAARGRYARDRRFDAVTLS
jgi:hypothetical protein